MSMFVRLVMWQSARAAVLPSLRPALVAGLLASLLLAGCASNIPAPVTRASRLPTHPSSAVPSSVAPSTAAQGASSNAVPGISGTSGSPTPTYTVKKGDTLHGIALDQGLYYRDLAAWNGIENPDKILVDQQLRLTPPEASGQIATTLPVTGPAFVEAHALDSKPPTLSKPLDSDKLKRGPKGGTQPYSKVALARLQQNEAPQVASIAPEVRIDVAPAPARVAPAPATPPATVPSPAPQAGDDAVDWMWPTTGKVIGMFAEGTNKGIDIAAKIGDPVLAAAAGKVVYVGSGLRGYGKLVIVKHNPLFLSAYAHNSQILVKEGQTVARGQKIAEAGNTDSEQPQLHFEIRRRGKPVDPLKHLPGRAP